MEIQWFIRQDRSRSGRNRPLLWPEHGEGDPDCQIRVAAETFKNSQFGRERDRPYAGIQPVDVLYAKAI
jgi:hypothetical protein